MDGAHSSGDIFVNTLLTRLQSVNRERWCIDRVRSTRTVGFRISQLAKMLYDDILTYDEKEHIKYLVEGVIYALVKNKLESLPCEDVISKRLIASINLATGHRGTVMFNININQAKQQVNVNIDSKAIQDIIKLLEFLYKEASKDWNYTTKRVVLQRVINARRVLESIVNELN